MTKRSKTTQELYRLIPELRKLARILAPTRDAAEDMLQDVLMNVWSQMSTGAKIETLRPYLMTAMRNRARRKLHKMQNLEDIPEPSHAPEAPLRLAAQEVLHAIARLPRDQSELLSDVAMTDASYAELAARHHLPVGTVMSRLARARASLRLDLNLSKDNPTAALLADD